MTCAVGWCRNRGMMRVRVGMSASWPLQRGLDRKKAQPVNGTDLRARSGGVYVTGQPGGMTTARADDEEGAQTDRRSIDDRDVTYTSSSLSRRGYCPESPSDDGRVCGWKWIRRPQIGTIHPQKGGERAMMGRHTRQIGRKSKSCWAAAPGRGQGMTLDAMTRDLVWISFVSIRSLGHAAGAVSGAGARWIGMHGVFKNRFKG